MRFEIILALVDRPGEMLKALEPIARNGGNIISIIHEREKPAEGFVPVNLIVDFQSKTSLKNAIIDLRKINVTITKSEEIVETKNITVIFVGKINTQILMKTSNQDFRITGYEVIGPSSKNPCTKLEIESTMNAVSTIVEKLRMISKKDKALLISSI